MSAGWDKVAADGGLVVNIKLNMSECGNINGWVIRGFEQPGFANFPWQIVLEQQDRARFDEIAAQFVAAGLCEYPPGWSGPPPVVTPPPEQPPPDPSDPLARFDSAPSQWAAWRFVTDEEVRALTVRFGSSAVVANRIAYYHVGGPGNVSGQHRPDGTYWFWAQTPNGEYLVQDINGAADQYIEGIGG